MPNTYEIFHLEIVEQGISSLVEHVPDVSLQTFCHATFLTVVIATVVLAELASLTNNTLEKKKEKRWRNL